MKTSGWSARHVCRNVEADFWAPITTKLGIDTDSPGQSCLYACGATGFTREYPGDPTHRLEPNIFLTPWANEVTMSSSAGGSGHGESGDCGVKLTSHFAKLAGS